MAVINIQQQSTGWFSARQCKIVVVQKGDIQEWEVVWKKKSRFGCTMTCGEESLTICDVNVTSRWIPFLVLDQSLEAEHNGKLLFQFKSRWFKNYVLFPDGEEGIIKRLRRGHLILKKIRILFASRKFNFCTKHDEFRVSDDHILAGICLALILWKIYVVDGD